MNYSASMENKDTSPLVGQDLARFLSDEEVAERDKDLPRFNLNDFHDPELVLPAKFCEEADINIQTLMRMRDNGDLILISDSFGNELLPLFQLHEGRVVDGIRESLGIFESPWETYRYLRMTCPDGSNIRFIEKLYAGEKDLVLSYFEGAMMGDFW